MSKYRETIHKFKPQHLRGAFDVQSVVTFRTSDGHLQTLRGQLGPIHADSAAELKARVLKHQAAYVRLTWTRIEVWAQYRNSYTGGVERVDPVLLIERTEEAPE